MERHEPQHRSLGRRSALLLICISLVISGCERTTGEQHPVREVATENALSSLLFEGPQLHASLRANQPEAISDLPTGMVLPKNPHLSTDAAFIEATARGGSQGNLDGTGMCSALYARYFTGKSEIGFYGLEAKSDKEADQREKLLREIWAHNASLGRTRVHRNGLILVVVWVWTDGEVPECWEAVNATVYAKLNASEVI